MNEENLAKNWSHDKLNTICEIIMGQSPKGSTYNNEGIGTGLINGAVDLGEKFPEPKTWTSKPTKLSKKGDIIIGIRASLGDVNYSDSEYCLGRGVAALRPTKKINEDFLYYLAFTLNDKFKKFLAGSTIKGITKSDLESILVSFPNQLEEQQKISKVLSNLDNAIQKANEIVRDTSTLKEGLTQHIFSKYLENSKLVPLKELSTKIIKGIFDLSPNNYVEQGIPFLRISDISENKLDLSSTKYITENKSAEFPNSELSPNDIVLAKVGASAGDVEKIALIPKEISKCNISQNMIGIKLNHEFCIPEYIFYFISRQNIMSLILAQSNTTTFKSIQLSVLKNLSIPLPSRNVQKSLTSILKNIDSRSQRQREYLHTLESLRNGLMQKLLTGKIYVQF